MRTNEELLNEIESANGGEGPDPTQSITNPILAQLFLKNMEIQTAERELDALVKEARKEGASWQSIGESLNMTRQGAHHKFTTKGAA